LYFRTCGSIKSANHKNIGSAKCHCHTCRRSKNLTNYFSPQICGFAEIICGPPTHPIHVKVLGLEYKKAIFKDYSEPKPELQFRFAALRSRSRIRKKYFRLHNIGCGKTFLSSTVCTIPYNLYCRKGLRSRNPIGQ
jgi:hypothetical protein